MKLLLHPKSLRDAILCLLVALGTGPALAQYKVVMPDGSVTYTDRPPTTSNARITPLGRGATGETPESGLPAELRTLVTRYPVTLYTTANCVPCDSGRRLLQQRGIPYTERRVSSEDDASALERLVGGRSVPSLSIGPQPLRGFSETDWGAYLDAAGYPRESKLPRNWPVPDPVPITDRAPVIPVTPSATPSEDRPAMEPANIPPPSGKLRF